MRCAITVGFEHGTGKAIVLAGPDVPIHEQSESFKNLPVGEHGTYSRIQLYELMPLKARKYSQSGDSPASAQKPDVESKSLKGKTK